jgi:hypothetical protein
VSTPVLQRAADAEKVQKPLAYTRGSEWGFALPFNDPA